MTCMRGSDRHIRAFISVVLPEPVSPTMSRNGVASISIHR